MLMVDVIERVNFNKNYIYNPNGATIDEKLKSFNEKVISLTQLDYYVRHKVEFEMKDEIATW